MPGTSSIPRATTFRAGIKPATANRTPAPRRPNVRYCDGSHKQLAYLRRRAAAARERPVRLTPDALAAHFAAGLKGELERLPADFSIEVLADFERQGLVVQADDGSFLRTASADDRLGEFWAVA